MSAGKMMYRFVSLLGGASLVALSSAIPAALAQTVQTGGIHGCPLVDGVLAADCQRPDAGLMVKLPIGTNTERDAAEDPGDLGFQIDIEPIRTDAERDKVLAQASGQGDQRAEDLALAASSTQVTYDGIGPRQRLAVATHDQRRGYLAGSPVRFRASTNYPAWISRAEVRIVKADRPTEVLAVLPVAPNAEVTWTMPAAARFQGQGLSLASGEDSGEYLYSLRVYGADGRQDETRRVPLSRISAAADLEEPRSGVTFGAGELEDMTARRSIAVRGGAVTVSGQAPLGPRAVSVMGEAVAVDASGRFVVQRILPPGQHQVAVDLGQGESTSRQIEIPEAEWFYVGQLDATFGRDRYEGSYALGRVAGYAKGNTAAGYTYTFSVDTREGKLSRLLRDLDQKNPDRLLRRIQSEDVYPTFGDDSQRYDDAPTSGKVYAKVEKGGSHLMWGDFRAKPDTSPLIRSDRTLYGVQGVYESPEVTEHGQPRYKISAYGANPDRLTQRDVLRSTGGSAYFLKRQDILAGTETVYIQHIDPASGRVTRSEQLYEGEDYEIDHFQGVIILRNPLASAGGDSFLSDRPLGADQVNLVVQYEYIPPSGQVDGYSVGTRGELWANDKLRFGVSAQRETTGIADNEGLGADILYRHSESTWARFDIARSEGPGFGSSFSLNGGLDMAPQTADPSALPSAGQIGNPAGAYAFSFRADMAEVIGGGMKGSIEGYLERKERGFVSADHDIDETQTAWGLSGDVELTATSRLRMAIESFRDRSGKRDDEGRITMMHQLDPRWSVEAGFAHLERRNAGFASDYSGARTDFGVRLMNKTDDDNAYWVFAQGTVKRSGNLQNNNRIGFGLRRKLTEAISAEGEISGGSGGAAGLARLIYDGGKGTTYHAGYTLDPNRAFERSVDGDGGVFVAGANRRLSEKVTLRSEASYDRLGDTPALTSTYGVDYAASERWTHSGSVDYGRTRSALNGEYRRWGLSLGTRFVDEGALDANIRGEYRRDTSTDGELNRDNWLLTGGVTWKMSDEARILFNIDALVSESDQSSLRDGRYIEANIGYAFRPVLHDRLNLLARYTYLEDLPGPDQVNVAGDIMGPRQRSHIFSIDTTFDLDTQWTVGAKLGHRTGEVETRGSGAFITNKVTLGVLRADYTFVHNWDAMIEGRMMKLHETNTTERGALAGLWRHLGSNAKLGAGYQWGRVSDDLRLIEGKREGVFLNLIAKF